MSDNESVYGTPTMVLLSAQNYAFTVSKEVYEIIIPRRGSYYEIDPDFFKAEDGEFDVLSNDTLWVPSISKILFATKKYPELKKNQLFALSAVMFDEDTVTIIGNVIDMNIQSYN